MRRSRRMRVKSAPPVIVRTEYRPTQEMYDYLMEAMKPFGKKVIVHGPDLDIWWPTPPAQRHGRRSREIRVVHELRQQVAPRVGLGAVGEG